MFWFMGTEAEGSWKKSPNVRRPIAHGKQNLARYRPTGGGGGGSA
jgi:hypothetical protein